MDEHKIYLVTYMGKDKRKWIKEQLILKYRHEEKASTFLDLRDIYQSRRNYDRDLKMCKNKPCHNAFVELGNIQY